MPDVPERLARLEERVSALRDDLRDVDRVVDELARAHVAGEAIARSATSRTVREFRSRELVIAGLGLLFTAVNVAVSVWG